MLHQCLLATALIVFIFFFNHAIILTIDDTFAETSKSCRIVILLIDILIVILIMRNLIS